MSAENTTELNVEVWPSGEAGQSEEAIGFNGVQYVSFINGSTYGKPALIAEDDNGARATPGSKVVYINPANIVAVEVERVA